MVAIVSIFIFMKLGKIKASEKQLNRENRIKWGRHAQRNTQSEQNNPKDIEDKPDQIRDQSKH